MTSDSLAVSASLSLSSSISTLLLVFGILNSRCCATISIDFLDEPSFAIHLESLSRPTVRQVMPFFNGLLSILIQIKPVAGHVKLHQFDPVWWICKRNKLWIINQNSFKQYAI